MILTQSVIKHFKLARDPFTGELGSGKDVMPSRLYSIVELRLWKAIDAQQMAALVGDVGSGKSTVISKVLEEMDRNKLYRIVRVYSLGRRKLSPNQLLDALLLDLMGDVYYSGPEIKIRLVREALDDVEKRGQKALLVIDEAHELPTQTLKDLKKLHEVQGKFSAPLSIVLAGQPRLQRRLQREVSLKEVLDRMEIIEVPGLKHGKDNEVLEYLEWKLKRAGGRKIDELFTPDGLEMLLSHPAVQHPLGVNNLVSRAMAVAVEARERKIDGDVMAHVFTEVSFDGQVEEEAALPVEKVA